MRFQTIVLTTTILVTSLTVSVERMDRFSSATAFPQSTSQSIPDLDPAQFIQDFEARYIPSGAMEPTVQVNDRLIIDKHTYKSESPKRGDIVIFKPTEALEKQNFKDSFIKRIIGLPGEIVEVKNGKVYINNIPLQENYIAEPPNYEYGPVKIPANSYFVLGDNRNNSYDSHYWGFVPQSLISGKAIGIFCPIERQGILDTSISVNSKNKQMLETIQEWFKTSPDLCYMKKWANSPISSR